MLLTPQDAELFFKLHRALMFFVNQRLSVIPNDIASSDEFSSLSPEMIVEYVGADPKQVEPAFGWLQAPPSGLEVTEVCLLEQVVCRRVTLRAPR